MKTELESILREFSQSATYYENSDANKIFIQLLFENSNNLIEIIERLIPLNFKVDDWILYRLAKDLKINELEYLSNKGFEIDKIDDNGENVLFKIFEQTTYNFTQETFQDFKDIFERLIKLNVDYSCKNSYGRNLIHQAIIYGANESLLKYIVSLDIDINEQDNDGFTPLHFVSKSISFNTLNLINILLENGASPSKTVKTKKYNYDTTEIPLPEGLTPLEIFEIEKENFIDYREYEKEIRNKLT